MNDLFLFCCFRDTKVAEETQENQVLLEVKEHQVNRAHKEHLERMVTL